MLWALLSVSYASAAPSVALGVNTAEAPGDGKTLDRFAARAGRRPAIVMWYQTWSEPLFYSAQMPEVDSRGAVPMITWEPTGVRLRDISAGRRDAYLRQAARLARRWRKPFFVRFAHEMNGDWYSWGRGAQGNSSAGYVRAWRHVVRVFRREGAHNVRWVWAPNVTGYGVRRFERLYPGDRWVDWVGLDGYNWGSLRTSGWREFGQVFGRSYDALTSLTKRPMMIAESGAPERGGDKAAWISSGLRNALPRRMPRVRALVWFDRRKEADWRVNSSPRALNAFRRAVRSSRFGLTRRKLLGLRAVPR